MKVKLLLFFFAFFIINSFSQNGFVIEDNKKKVVIPFKFINNLIIVPIDVNGATMNFLLDTGVEETILFSLEENEEIIFSNLDKVMFKGIGVNEPFEGLKSSKNKLSIDGYRDDDHTLYIVLNQNINISSQVGIPVNGIIGYHFFKNHPISINYKKKRITVYNDISTVSKKLNKKYQKVAVSIEEMKPYIKTTIQMENSPEVIEAKLLIDIGNSDALWLFKEKDKRIHVSDKNFDDYLGLGFSGTIYGKRCRIKKLLINNFTFENPIVAIPDSITTKGMQMVKDRVGSIGSEIMKRFSVVFDYPNNQMYLMKNDNFKLLFNYNMSGLEIQHQGLEWVKETYEENASSANIFIHLDDGGKTSKTLKYKFVLKPSYSVFSVRKDSPSDVAGLKIGDEITTINGRNSYNFTLQEINEILKSEDDKTIIIEVLRKSKPLKFKFKLKNMI
ncbi:MAG: PDZ domain-containing protein [Bacteroidota bacterium]